MHRSQSDCAEPYVAVPEAGAGGEAVVYLDADGVITKLSPEAESFFGTGEQNGPPGSPADFLLDAAGLPLGQDFLQTFLFDPALEPLRRTGTPLIARLPGGRRLRVHVSAQADNESAALHLKVSPEQEDQGGFGGYPVRALQAAAQGRQLLLRDPQAASDSLWHLCQSLVDAGYKGAVLFRPEDEHPGRLKPIAWARTPRGSETEPELAPEEAAGPEAPNSIGQALQSGQPVLGSFPQWWPGGSPGQSGCFGEGHCLALPLARECEPGAGVLGVVVEDPDAVESPERQILAELAADLGSWLARGARISPSSREGEDELAGILEATPDFLAVLDPEGRIRYLNSGGLNLLGRPEEEVWNGRPLTDFQPSAALRRFQEDALPTVMEQGSWRGETVVLSAQGAEIPVDQTLVAHAGPDGEIRSLFTIIRDISDRKREEARLRDSEEKYRRILEAAQEGFWIVHDQLQGDERPQLRFKVPVSKGSRIVLVDLPEVWYFQADGHYTQVYTRSESYLCNLSVSDLERRLDNSQFVRIHRSYIINLQHTQVLERMDDQWCVTVGDEDGERLPVSRRNVEKVKVMLGVS